ncbi:MAG: helix-turn-helix domain-containing protein [Chlamydiae bacterium]|nr:helix-turn-helix domain-containing protein [Chlamydiota bacterium]
MRPISPLPIPIKKALRKLGWDIRNARLRRRITMVLMAERASISRSTLTKVEAGDPSVALGIYASVIFVLGLTTNLANLLDPGKDKLGQTLEEENLPQRVRLPKRPRPETIEND